MITVYCITCKISGKAYVGQTTRPLRIRFKRHCLRDGRWPLKLAIQKYGRGEFTIKTLEECPTPEAANLAEIRWIKDLGTLSPNGYNIRPGGECKGPLPEAIRQKLIGQRRSAETRARMRKPKSESHRAAISIGRWGRKATGMSEDKVREILLRYFQGEKQSQLAHDFGVSRGLIKAIVHRRAWKQVPIPEVS